MSTKSNIVGIVGICAVMSLLLMAGLFYATFGTLNLDENFYLLSAKKVMEGAIPYRDFAYTQPPILPYINGLILEIVGYSFVNLRFLNLLWCLSGLMVLAAVMRKRFDTWEPAALSVCLAGASPHFLSMTTMGKTHSAAMAFLSVAVLSTLWKTRFLYRSITFALAAAVCVGCRLTVSAALPGLWIALALQAKDRKQVIYSALIAIAAVLVANLPFVIAAPENAWFFLIEYHMGSELNRRGMDLLLEFWRMGPAALLAFGVGLLCIGKLVRAREWTAIALLISALLGMALALLPTSAYGSYTTPIIPLAAVSGINGIHLAFPKMGRLYRVGLWLLVPISIFQPSGPLIDPIPPAAEIQEAVGVIKDHTKSGPMLTPFSAVAIEADREIVKGTEMGAFSVMGPGDGKRAAQLNLIHPTELTSLLENQTPEAIVFSKGQGDFNMAWQVPAYHPLPVDHRKRFDRLLKANYHIVWEGLWLRVYLPNRIKSE